MIFHNCTTIRENKAGLLALLGIVMFGTRSYLLDRLSLLSSSSSSVPLKDSKSPVWSRSLSSLARGGQQSVQSDSLSQLSPWTQEQLHTAALHSVELYRAERFEQLQAAGRLPLLQVVRQPRQTVPVLTAGRVLVVQARLGGGVGPGEGGGGGGGRRAVHLRHRFLV